MGRSKGAIIHLVSDDAEHAYRAEQVLDGGTSH